MIREFRRKVGRSLTAKKEGRKMPLFGRGGRNKGGKGSYDPRFTHDERGHRDELTMIRLLAASGTPVEPASARQDEVEKIDFFIYFEIAGRPMKLKVQFKTRPFSGRELDDLNRRRILPIFIDGHWFRHLGDYGVADFIVSEFWDQVRAALSGR